MTTPEKASRPAGGRGATLERSGSATSENLKMFDSSMVKRQLVDDWPEQKYFAFALTG